MAEAWSASFSRRQSSASSLACNWYSGSDTRTDQPPQDAQRGAALVDEPLVEISDDESFWRSGRGCRTPRQRPRLGAGCRRDAQHLAALDARLAARS